MVQFSCRVGVYSVEKRRPHLAPRPVPASRPITVRGRRAGVGSTRLAALLSYPPPQTTKIFLSPWGNPPLFCRPLLAPFKRVPARRAGHGGACRRQNDWAPPGDSWASLGIENQVIPGPRNQESSIFRESESRIMSVTGLNML